MFFQLRRRAVSWFLFLLLWGHSCPFLHGDIVVHFIDVGQADAILVESDGENMLVDGGNGADSSLIYAYLKRHGIERIKYLVNSHPHEDHVGGLPGALNYATVERGFSSYRHYDSEAFRDYVCYLAMQGLELEVLEAGTRLSLGGATIRVLGPLVRDSEVNDNSLVLLVEYGEVSFLLTGDVERDGENRLVDAGLVPRCTVLKVAHHGSNDSTGYRFLRAALPEYGVISVGKNNGYGHPTEEVLSRLEDAGVEVFRTDWHGHVVARSDGTAVTFSLERSAPPAASTAKGAATGKVDKVAGGASGEASYILNTNSKKFHLPGCSAARRMKDANRKDYGGKRQDLLDQDYEPCGICKP